MAPLLPQPFDLSAYLSSLSLAEREEISRPQSQLTRRDENERSPGPWAVRVKDGEWQQEPHAMSTKTIQLQQRDNIPTPTGAPNHGGAVNPSDVNMKAVQAVFAIIGCSMVLGIIWFFFWAKNGGFQWRKGDWEEYKSTVLRRKGPNGTTLSNATKSTRLGGGSVVGEGYSDRDNATSYADETSTVYTGTMTELSSSTAPIIKEKQGAYTGDKRSRKKKARREETAKERKQREMREAEFEGAHDADVRAYMREKPARVGGINTTGDTLHYGTDYTDTESSVAYSQSNATRPPPQNQARRPAQPANPNAGRRDFSYTIGGQQHQEQEQFSVASSQRSESPPPLRVPAPNAAQQTPRVQANRYHNMPHNARNSVPGGYAPSSYSGYTDPLSELQQSNTKTYHHPIPGLRGGNNGGFRRGGGDLDD